ncbi:formyltransferase family protein [Aliarcobacter cryaerophilus]|uniref:formyltransferase family protein n=1 Tax=Aliarcobacter cryaerophilus TaxID=28198 RepID=UPI0011DFB7BD|nr:formyltransferase family protein [Aliarcobacter cryaerophilus]
MKYCFNKIKKIIFLGGSSLLYEILKNIDSNVEKVVFTSERFSEEIIDDKKFIEQLKNLNIKFHVVDDINNNEDIKREIIQNYTLGFSVSASWIIKQNIIDLFDGKLVNIHGSRLPQFRGGGGVSWNILQGNRLDGFVIHFITTGIDDGIIIDKVEFIFPDSCKTPLEYYSYKNQMMVKKSVDFINQVLDSQLFSIYQQQEEFSSYWPRLNTDKHGFIDWNWSLNDIEKFINAFDEPYNGAITFCNGRQVRVKNVFINHSDGNFHPFQKGIIYRKNNQGYFVATEEGTLIIKSLKGEEDKDLFDFIQCGDRLYTPQSKIEESFSTRVFYNHQGLKVK